MKSSGKKLLFIAFFRFKLGVGKVFFKGSGIFFGFFHAAVIIPFIGV